MGTGGLAAAYDGRKIVYRRGGHGYLIDDLGGGYELGKRFLAAWFNGDLPNKIEAVLGEKIGSQKSDILHKVYREQNLGLISSIVPIVAQFSQDDVIRKLLSDYFYDFIKYQVKPLCVKQKVDQFSVVGSVGYIFYQQLKGAAKMFDLGLDQCIQSPIHRLVKYHS